MSDAAKPDTASITDNKVSARSLEISRNISNIRPTRRRHDDLASRLDLPPGAEVEDLGNGCIRVCVPRKVTVRNGRIVDSSGDEEEMRRSE